MVERPNPKINPSTPQDPYKLKIALVGEQGVGKTCFCKEFAKGVYDITDSTTVGSDFYSRTMNVSKGNV